MDGYALFAETKDNVWENHLSLKINNKKIDRKTTGFFEHNNGSSD